MSTSQTPLTVADAEAQGVCTVCWDLPAGEGDGFHECETTTEREGEPLRVEVERIRALRPREELPSIEELSGSDPDFTGGMSTEEYLRSIRVG